MKKVTIQVFTEDTPEQIISKVSAISNVKKVRLYDETVQVLHFFEYKGFYVRLLRPLITSRHRDWDVCDDKGVVQYEAESAGLCTKYIDSLAPKRSVKAQRRPVVEEIKKVEVTPKKVLTPPPPPPIVRSATT